MNLVTSLSRKMKFLIAGATIVAAAVAFAVAEAGSAQIWNGRTTLTIGMAPSLNYVLLADTVYPSPMPIEPPRLLVARISNPAFRTEVLNEAKFEPSTAARSRTLATTSMRGIVLESDRDIAIELSAASPADVEAAFRALGTLIEKEHGAILDERKELLQAKIAKARSRMEQIEKSSDQLVDRLLAKTDDRSGSQLSIYTAIPAWNELEDRIQRDQNLKLLSTLSVLHLESGTYIQGSRNVAALNASLLAGLAMLVAMVALTIAINLRTQPPLHRDAS
jgi:hypothetical protein